MSTELPSNTRVLLARSTNAPELRAFAVWLGSKHYTPFVTHRHLLRLEQVLSCLSGPMCNAEDLHAAFNAVGRGVPSRPPVFRGTERAYARFLLAHGRLVKNEHEGRHATLCADYQRQLLELRGLSLSARGHHAATVADLLARGLGPDQSLSALTLVDIERFVALRSREVSRHSLQHVVAYLRSFLRFCHDQGVISQPLDAIETPRTYRGELPPQALDWSAVQALLRSINLYSKAGRRDHCILHLMAHYGLRPSEAVALRLDSINWETCVLHVVQRKTRCDLFLPLASQTLRILRSYLAHERLPQGTSHPELFLRVRCPIGPIERFAVCDLFKKRVRLAKLELPGRNVYRLRHTFAMRLLTQGVGVKAIGDVLGQPCRKGDGWQCSLRHGSPRWIPLPVDIGKPIDVRNTREGAAMSHAKDATTASQNPEPAFYRLSDVIRITALSRSSIYRRVAAGEFPTQTSLGGRAKGWRREALQAWIGDPAGFRPLTNCEVQQSASGARVRHVAAP